jgi:predicted phage baseplate assembly protein
MFVPLPELDDRRFRDLVDEGRSLIPTYAPSWTDHNAHDPGITILEALAWVAETAMYGVDRVPDRHRRAFLSLVGIEPEPARPASTVVQFATTADDAVLVPSGSELAATLLDGRPGLFQTLGDLSVLPTSLVAIQVSSRGRFSDESDALRRAASTSLFGIDPALDDALYLGFDAPIEEGSRLRLELELADERSGWDERQRLEREILGDLPAWARALGAGAGNTASGLSQHALSQHPMARRHVALAVAQHHSAELTWEAQVGAGVWQRLEARDETRGASLSGSVWLDFPAPTQAARVGVVEAPLHYVRCRLSAGALDRAPLAAAIRANAARARQVADAFEGWPIAAGVVAGSPPPPCGAVTGLSVEFRAGQIVAFDFDEPSAGKLCVRILEFAPASNQAQGRLVVGARRLGVGTGAPHQRLALPGPHVLTEGFELFTVEGGETLRWEREASLRARGPADRAFLLDFDTNEVVFGDGQNGRVPPHETTIIVVARYTAGAGGNVAAQALSSVADTPSNRAKGALAAALQLHNPRAAVGGIGPEPLLRAEGRAFQSVQQPERTVTLADCERLALETPGASIARAAARANCIPGLDCHTALGFITVVVLPYLPKGRPQPSPGLLAAVARYLDRRRVLGTRILVAPPEYLEVGVNAEVRAVRGWNKEKLRAAIDAELRAFLDPLTGGPERSGWPLGRDVYVSEVLEGIARVPGVDHVVSLAIVVPGCGPSCGDVCVRPLSLVVSGAHQISVT